MPMSDKQAAAHLKKLKAANAKKAAAKKKAKPKAKPKKKAYKPY